MFIHPVLNIEMVNKLLTISRITHLQIKCIGNWHIILQFIISWKRRCSCILSNSDIKRNENPPQTYILSAWIRSKSLIIQIYVHGYGMSFV